MKPKKVLNNLMLLFSFAYLIGGNIMIAFADNGSNTCTYVLGDYSNHTSLAYYVQEGFTLLKIAGPLLLIVMTLIDLIKVISSQKNDELSKMGAKTVKRVIFAVLLFVIPSLLDWIFKLFGIYGVCGIK